MTQPSRGRVLPDTLRPARLTDVLEDGDDAPPPDPARAGRGWWTAERWDDLAAIVLAVTAVLAAWAAYQASRYGGAQSEHITMSSTLRANSSLAAATTVLEVQIDWTAFMTWTQALGDKDLEEAAFHRERFRPELATAVDAWLDGVDPTSLADLPPSMPQMIDAYDLEAQRQVEQLVDESNKELELAAEADRTADVNVLVTVVLAISLFLAGIGSRFRSPRLKAGLTLMAAGIMVVSTIVMLTLPQDFDI